MTDAAMPTKLIVTTIKGLCPPQLLLRIFLWTILLGGCKQAPLVQIRFSPHGGCEQLVVQTINKAQALILVQAYYFTAAPIADAVLAAHQRGVTVRVLVDKSQQNNPSRTQIYQLANAGIAVAIDHVETGCAHNKVIIIDDGYVLTGSYNWTVAAEKCNAENLLLIKDTAINQRYKKAWLQRAAQARPLQ